MEFPVERWDSDVGRGEVKIARLAPLRGRKTASTLCPVPEVGVVVVFGLTADRNGLTDFPIFGRLGGLWIALVQRAPER